MRRAPISHNTFIWITLFLALPLVDSLLPNGARLIPALKPVLIFAIYGMALHVITGLAGILHLGMAGFIAIGAYSFSILSSPIYPFQLGFWGGVLGAGLFGALFGCLISMPTLRLKGDYLAMVTLGFGEIVQDSLKNLEVITKGTQGINPIPYPTILGFELTPERHLAWYYLLLLVLFLANFFLQNLSRSKLGRAWQSVKEDSLVSDFLGISVSGVQLRALIVGSVLASIGGALWASSLGSSGEPSNYDFQVSVIALCVIIVGGLGSLTGVLVGALVMVGANSILLVRLSEWLARQGWSDSTRVWSVPNNWKYMLFGLALILMMRWKPSGLLPARGGQRDL